MAKIDRATQKIFGNDANSTAITQFGTAKDAQPKYIDDTPTGENPIEFLQSNSAFTNGWANSLEQDLAPFMQDSNALWYMITSQMAYLMQQGVPEYDAGSEYPTGALCKVINNGTVILYKALQDMLGDNIGHNPNVNDGVYWTIYSSDDNLAKYEIGLPQPSLSNTKKDNEVWLDGTEGTNGIVAISQYRNLYNIWGTRYGGDGVTTFGLPNMTDKCLWGVDSLGYLTGTGYLDPTLPNIKCGIPGSESVYKKGFTPDYGAAYKISSNVVSGESVNNKYDNDFWGMDANTYNPIYQDDATVRPPAVKVRWKTRYY